MDSGPPDERLRHECRHRQKLNSIVAGIGGDSDTYATIIAAIDGKIAGRSTA